MDVLQRVKFTRSLFKVLQVLLYSTFVAGLYFTEEPQDRVVALDGPLWWHCQVSADNPVVYIWRYGDADLPTRTGQRVYSNGTLYINRVLAQDENQPYTCIATSGDQSIESREATLQLAYIALTFTQHPVGQTVFLGNRSVLTCQITSLPPAIIIWTHDNQSVTMGTVTMAVAGSSTLTFSDVSYLSAGKYKCQATNPLLSVVRYSREAELVVIGPPVLGMNFSSQSVPLGYTARFDVSYYGNPSPQVSWYKQSASVDNATSLIIIQNSAKYKLQNNGGLLVNDVMELDAGTFVCRLENVYGQFNQSAALIVTGEATVPVITSTQDDVTAVEGSTVTLICRADGNPLPTISWRRNNSTVYPGGQYSLSQQGDLTITDLQQLDMGYFMCLANNPEGNASYNVYIDVQVGPSVIVSPEDTTVLEGQMTSLFCLAAGNPSPNISWASPSNELYTAPTEVQDGILVDGNGTLIILRTERKHDGIYKCTASNHVAIATAVAILHVEAPPMFTQLPISVGVRKGQRVYFHCQATGYPVPTMYWTKQGQDGRLHTTASYQVYLNNTLVFFSADVTDTGVYWCHADNNRGNKTAVATLTVSAPPEFTVIPTNQTVRIGSHVQIDCVAVGDPVPTQTWSLNNRDLILDDNMQLFPNSTLIITGIRPTQVGQYTCTAVNVAGSASVTVTIETKDIPEFSITPSNKTANQSDSVTFQCKGVAIEMPSVMWYKILTGDDLLPLATQNENGRIYVNSDGDLKVMNVSSADQGWYKCRLFNSVSYVTAEAYLQVQVPPFILNTNSPQTTERLTAVTLSCQSSGSPTPALQWISPIGQLVIANDSAYHLTSHTLQIQSTNEERDGGNWTCQSCNLLGCVEDVVQLFVQGKPVITSFRGSKSRNNLRLECRVMSLPEASVSFTSEGQSVTSNTEGHTVDGVTIVIDEEALKTQYSCLATNRYGSAISSISVPGVMSVPSILNITSRKITLQATSPSDQSGLPLLGFNVESKVANASGWQSSGDVYQETVISVKDLTPYTIYSFRVAAVNILGTGSYSQQTTAVRTLPDAPSSPQNVFAVKSGNSTILLSWQPPLQINDKPENLGYHYQVWGLADKDEYDTLYISERIPYNQSAPMEITGLVHKIKYNISVKAVNIALEKDSEPAWVLVDFSVSGQLNTNVGIQPDNIIAIVFGVLGSGAVILVLLYVFVQVRHMKKSDTMSLINKRPSLDQFYMENPKSLYHGRKSGFSLKGRVSSSNQGFYKVDEAGLNNSHRGSNSSNNRIMDKDVLLMASNPLYEEVNTDLKTNPTETGSSLGLPSPNAADMVHLSCAQTEIELPGTDDNFVLRPTTVPEVPESSAGSDITKEDFGQSMNQHSVEKDAESEVTELERTLDEIYSLGLSEASTDDHLYSSPIHIRSDITSSPLPAKLPPASPSMDQRDRKPRSAILMSEITNTPPVIQVIRETALSDLLLAEEQEEEDGVMVWQEVGEVDQGRQFMEMGDNPKERSLQRDIKVEYEMSPEEIEESLQSAVLY